MKFNEANINEYLVIETLLLKLKYKDHSTIFIYGDVCQQAKQQKDLTKGKTSVCLLNGEQHLHRLLHLAK